MPLMIPPEALLEPSYGEVKFVGIPIEIAEIDVNSLLIDGWKVVQPKYTLMLMAVEAPESEE